MSPVKWPIQGAYLDASRGCNGKAYDLQREEALAMIIADSAHLIIVGACGGACNTLSHQPSRSGIVMSLQDALEARKERLLALRKRKLGDSAESVYPFSLEWAARLTTRYVQIV